MKEYTPKQAIQKVAIIGANRIPFAKANTVYADASAEDMLSAALSGLIERYNLANKGIGEVVCGTLLKPNAQFSLTKEALLNTSLPATTPAYDISQACVTSMQAAFSVANKIALGMIDSAIAGGADSASDIPIGLGNGVRKALLRFTKAKNTKERLLALLTINPKELILLPNIKEPRTRLSMGEHQALTTNIWQITRQAQDEFAFSSHQKLEQAYQAGFFDTLMSPYKGIHKDNVLRTNTSLEKLNALPVVFGKTQSNPTMTAGNSSVLTDGASVMLLASDDWAKNNQYKPMAYLTHQITQAIDFMGKDGETEGLLMAPIYAVSALLKKTQLSLQDFDFYEIHEAFASQVLCTLSAWQSDDFCRQKLGLNQALGSIHLDRLNVSGGSLATGHPFSATGTRLIANAAKLLEQKGSGRALVVCCAASGQAAACILER